MDIWPSGQGPYRALVHKSFRMYLPQVPWDRAHEFVFGEVGRLDMPLSVISFSFVALCVGSVEGDQGAKCHVHCSCHIESCLCSFGSVLKASVT